MPLICSQKHVYGMCGQTAPASPQPAPKRRTRAHSKCSESGMVVQKPVPGKEILRKHLDQGSFHTYWPRRKTGRLKAGIQAVMLRCFLMKTHQEPLGATRRQLSRTSSALLSTWLDHHALGPRNQMQRHTIILSSHR